MIKYKKGIAIIVGTSCIAILSAINVTNTCTDANKRSIVASAVNNVKDYKWTKKVVDDGTTINVEYLWPDEPNASFTSVYRDGKKLSDEKMITITPGSVYHFRGVSDTSILYTEIYVGTPAKFDVMSGETGTWYNLLPSKLRKLFEKSGWTWQIGWEYTGRAYLDTDGKRIMIKENDPKAVLYGMGLYLDNKYGYSSDEAFKSEGDVFTNTFGTTDNLFAQALECYYAKGGELQTVCPNIYVLVTKSVTGDDKRLGAAQTSKKSRQMPEKSEKPIETPMNVAEAEPVLMKDLLRYANKKRKNAGLRTISWSTANDKNVSTRVREILEHPSQTRPNGTDAFSAYTKSIKCEIRMKHISTPKEAFESASRYFYLKNLKSINCATYEDAGILIFEW